VRTAVDCIHLLVGEAVSLSVGIYAHTKPTSHPSRRQKRKRTAACLQTKNADSAIQTNVAVADDGSVRLTAIGLSAICLHSPPYTGYTGRSYAWIPPEVLQPAESSEDVVVVANHACKPSSDVYSFAMTIYEVRCPVISTMPMRHERYALQMYTGHAPFGHHGHYSKTILDVIWGIRPRRPTPLVAPQMTDGIWGVIEKCWDQDPRKRPSMLTVCALLEDMENE
jgi:hypothetical protein